MLPHAAAGKGNLSVTDIGHLDLRRVRSPNASPPPDLPLDNIGPLLPGLADSQTFEKRISHENLSGQNVTSQPTTGERKHDSFEPKRSRERGAPCAIQSA